MGGFQTLPETMLTGVAFTIDDTKERSFVPGATVLIQPAAGDTVQVTTDEQGRFTAPVAPGRYRVSLEVTGMEATPVDVDLHPGEGDTRSRVEDRSREAIGDGIGAGGRRRYD